VICHLLSCRSCIEHDDDDDHHHHHSGSRDDSPNGEGNNNGDVIYIVDNVTDITSK
jgi:hypothetical protein